MKLEYQVKGTEYDESSRKVVLTLTTSVNIPKNEYGAVQKITGNRFGEFYNIQNPTADSSFGGGRIGVGNGRVVRLDLDSLSLREIDSSLRELNLLEGLSLSYNKLIQLPEWIGELKSLKFLTLNNCGLTFLPESIGELENLIYLQIRSYAGSEYPNQLTSLPQSIGQLRSLSALWIDNNQLIGFPDSIWELPELSQIEASGNQIAKVPERIEKLERVSLNLKGNPLNSKSKRFLKQLQRAGRCFYY